MTRSEAIAWIEWCRKAHVNWARWQEGYRRAGEQPVPHVGSATHHRKCIKKYDGVLKLLRAGMSRPETKA